MISQREAIAEFIRENRPPFNPSFFERDEDEIIRELMNVIHSCERENQYFTVARKDIAVPLHFSNK